MDKQETETHPFHLHGKNAIITGGGSGIGESIAKVFAANGARVFLLDIDEAAANDVAGRIARAGGAARALRCDVARQAEVDAAVEFIQSGHPIHILVNNAGIGHIGTAESTTEEELDRLYQINVKGVYNGMRACIPHFRRNGGGAILNLASIVAWIGIPDRFGYSMTKGAVLAMTLSVAKDYIKDNIRCNSISPARVHTPFVDSYLARNYPGREKEMYDRLAATQPIGRMGRPDEVAHLALFLCSDAAAFITGSDYPIDGGFIKLNN
jgi:2-keto-3-deoxy-L-fuconate dehydrogenase